MTKYSWYDLEYQLEPPSKDLVWRTLDCLVRSPERAKIMAMRSHCHLELLSYKKNWWYKDPEIVQDHLGQIILEWRYNKQKSNDLD